MSGASEGAREPAGRGLTLLTPSRGRVARVLGSSMWFPESGLAD